MLFVDKLTTLKGNIMQNILNLDNLPVIITSCPGYKISEIGCDTDTSNKMSLNKKRFFEAKRMT